MDVTFRCRPETKMYLNAFVWIEKKEDVRTFYKDRCDNIWVRMFFYCFFILFISYRNDGRVDNVLPPLVDNRSHWSTRSRSSGRSSFVVVCRPGLFVSGASVVFRCRSVCTSVSNGLSALFVTSVYVRVVRIRRTGWTRAPAPRDNFTSSVSRIHRIARYVLEFRISVCCHYHLTFDAVARRHFAFS